MTYFISNATTRFPFQEQDKSLEKYLAGGCLRTWDLSQSNLLVWNTVNWNKIEEEYEMFLVFNIDECYKPIIFI